ncbi:MAG: hypothetical protein WAV45_14475 [Propionibacteriaceae bacterium]|nr:hypothetical protein [Micropruina sp.]HBX82887.1 hypothetical protein [Propionibacteriaceae bacterium]
MNTTGCTARELTLALADADRRERQAAADKAQLIAALCDVYRATDGSANPALPGAERLITVGADGTPVVSDFLVLEIGPLLGMSEASAGMLICDALNLRHRHPLLWQAVGELKVEVWKARRIANDVARAGLTLDAALAIDEKITPYLDKLPVGPLLRKLSRMIVKADEVLAEQRAKKARRERFVRIHHDIDGVSTVVARVATSDAIALDTALTLAASDAILTGRSEGVDELRSVAFGDLALAYLNNPGPAVAPASSTANRRIPRVAEIVVHITRETLTDGRGVARVEGVGPMLLDQVREVLGGCSKIKIQPVIDLNDDPGVDTYEIPDRIRRHVNLRNPVEGFPFSSRNSARCDLDHTSPYRHGQPKQAAQTRASNLGPLSRKVHRAKTLGAWTLTQPTPGTFLWTSPMGLTYTVDRHGTTRGHKQVAPKLAATAKVPRPTPRKPIPRRRP